MRRPGKNKRYIIFATPPKAWKIHHTVRLRGKKKKSGGVYFFPVKVVDNASKYRSANGEKNGGKNT